MKGRRVRVARLSALNQSLEGVALPICICSLAYEVFRPRWVDPLIELSGLPKTITTPV